MRTLEESKIAVLGLGYVGLPLAVEFSKHFETIGFDISERRVAELSDGTDATLEVSVE
jgi:UDP-N-acetyl-D-galactosamine dehydrogenase